MVAPRTVSLVRTLLPLAATCLIASTVTGQPSPSDRPAGEREPVASRWSYEDGPPRTYQEFMELHPYRPFREQRLYDTPRGKGIGIAAEPRGRFGIFVNTTLYGQPPIPGAVEQYIADLESEGWEVVLIKTEGGLPQDLKALIVPEYEAGMVGCVLVGDLPTAWFENVLGAGNGWHNDIYYGDMDGTWLDRDGNGLFDQHTAGQGDRAPEIWVMRLYTTTLDGDEVELIVNYFRKNHAYREGTLTLPRRALDYVDDDWAGRQAPLEYVYNDVTRVNDNQETTAEDFKKRLTEGYSLIRLWCHSNADFHRFRDTPDYAVAYAHCYVHSPVFQQGQLRLGSDDGIKVWLNGTHVCTYDVYRGHEFDANAVSVSLQQGWNTVLVKAADKRSGFGFSARFTDRGGSDLSGLTYRLDDPAGQTTAAMPIRAWLINGFYPNDRNWYRCLDHDYLGGEADIDAREGERNGDFAWQKITSPSGYINLNAAYRPVEDLDKAVSYAFVRVYSPTTQSVELRLGSDESTKVWFNGVMVHKVNETRVCTPDDDRVTVVLKAGWNRLLIKVNEWLGDHGFTARIARSDGTEVAGLTYDPPPEPATGWIRDWLVNGWYRNLDDETRLSEDYLGGETTVRPTTGPMGGAAEWSLYYSPEDYIDLNDRVFDESGGRVYDDDVRAIDPCCFFYDLWCCGSRRFPQSNYLDGWYIFTDSYGLASWGLLSPPKKFYAALAEGKCLGEAQLVYLNEAVTEDSYGWADAFGMYGDPTLVPGVSLTSNILYVDGGAAGTGDGSSWPNAYPHLQNALAAAHSGDEIRVAAGLYKPDQGAGITPGDRAAAFELKSGVVIKGGYAGLGGLQTGPASGGPDARDIVQFQTILSGSIGSRVAADNSYHVVRCGSAIRETGVLDGFTITDGYADGADPDDCGAGLYNDEGSPTLVDCTFKDNHATAKGGGLYNGYQSEVKVTDCRFIANSANHGGGMYNHYGSPVLTRCVFNANSAGSRGGGVHSYAYGKPTLAQCTFHANSAEQGGGLYNSYTTPTVTNCVFTGNSAKWGGGLFNGQSTLSLINCTFTRNVASTNGGGISNYWDDSDATLLNCIFWADTPNEIQAAGGVLSATYCDVQGSWPGTGNRATDPFFAAAASGDCHLRSQEGRWDAGAGQWVRDSRTSPCIDAGDARSDWSAEPSPNGGRINMGAYGGTAEASKSDAGR